MALVDPVIFQAVGYQNSGKTTFLLKLIQLLSEQGIKTITIKHHGHGGKPEVIQEKDSSKHLEAGALASLVEGDGRIVIQADGINWRLEEQIHIMKFFSPNIIIIEGHKREPYPKLVFLRNENDLSLLTKVNNVNSIMVWKEDLFLKVREMLDVPVFHINDDHAIVQIARTLNQLVRKIDGKNE